jgi:hypothetical protein
MRLGADGLSLTQITNEPEPVIDFDVSPESGHIAYTSNNNLIETDLNGGSRLVKVTGQPLSEDSPEDFIIIRITSPRYSPDGSLISFGLNGVNIIQSGAATDYEVALPSDPYPDLNDPNSFEPPIHFYSAGEWSPDGTKLAVSFSYFPEGGGLAILNLADGSLAELTTPEYTVICCEYTWTEDSTTGYVASNLLAYGVPGLFRFDAASGEGAAIISGLPGNEVNVSPENPYRFFKSAFPESNGSILTFMATAETNQQVSSLPSYTMHRVSPEGTATPLRTDRHPIWNAFWAEDGRGAIIVDNEFNPRYPATGPMRWLPADGDPILDLPASGSQMRWGNPVTAVPSANNPTEADFANLKSQALADFDLELLDDSINDLFYSRLNLGDGRSLYFIHTLGFRSLEQNHAVGIYAFDNGSWATLATYILPHINEAELTPGPDYLNTGSVQQTFIEPTNGWLTIEGGIGAHGGTFHLLRFDGQSLILEAVNSNGSPGAGDIRDINGDGRFEALLNLTDYYIFSYAAGVRLINYEIRHWNGSDLVPVMLTRLENTTTATDLNNQAINLTEAELWIDARMVIDMAAESDPGNETIEWNAAVINTIADARENANSSFPLMDFVFAGDYNTVIDILRNYNAPDLFSRESTLIVGTSAEGSVDIMAEWTHTYANNSLTLRPDMASALFLRGWAAFLLNPEDPAVLADIQQAAALDPDEPLYAEALAFLQP